MLGTCFWDWSAPGRLTLDAVTSCKHSGLFFLHFTYPSLIFIVAIGLFVILLVPLRVPHSGPALKDVFVELDSFTK